MEPCQNQPDELHELCEQLINGRLTPEESSRLEALVRESTDARRYVTEHLNLHATLHWESGRLGQQGLPEQLAAAVAGLESPDDKIVPLPGGMPWQQKLAYLAACLVFLVAGVWVGRSFTGSPNIPALNAPAPAVATLTKTRGCRWEDSALPTVEGARLPAGKLALTDGLATLHFDSGAVVTLEAPAELEIVNRDLCVLHRGMLTAHVPKEAIGFTVDTANAKIIDHGTDFGVSAGLSGEAHVQVFEGLVEVKHNKSGEDLRLTTGEMAVMNNQSVIGRNSGSAEAERSLKENPVEESGNGNVTLTTASGLGRTAYIFSPGTTNHQSTSLMLVKNTYTPGYRRKAYFSFDLATLHGRKVKTATMSLAFEPSGFGFASRMPTSTFTVYGLIDETLDNWSEQDLRWDNAPANRPGGNELDTAKVIPLGTFSIAPEETSGLRIISGPALADFLNHDSNGQATFIIVRETSEPVIKGHASGLVHGFAGNYHPTAPPPTLRLTTAQN